MSSAPIAPAPELSIVIPLFNCLALTQAMVASLQATLPAGLRHEIILVDDGSTDGTGAWLSSLPAPFRVLSNERNRGYAVANNRAVAQARGAFLALLNNDLILQPNWLEPMLAALQSRGRRAGPVGNVQFDARTGEVDHTGIIINRTGKPVHDRRLPPSWCRRLRPVRTVPAVTGACFLVARALWEQLGGFDEGFLNGGEDVDFCLRARREGRETVVALRSIVRHHISSSPGRKRRDEENSYRLAQRWRTEFIALGGDATRDWCRNYLQAALVRPESREHLLARRALWHASGLSAKPPPEALADLEAGLAGEFTRWEAMFGGR